MVSSLDSESSDRGSNPRETCLYLSWPDHHVGLDRAKHASHPLGAIISYVVGLAAELFFRVFVVLAPTCSRTRPGTACAPNVVLQNRPNIYAIGR